MRPQEVSSAAVPDPFEEPVRKDQHDGSLIVDVDGFEGPLDLLLALARQQKLDLTRISILALAEQYLAFIETARSLRLEMAADYLVMAAWLAYLKSRLLLPKEENDGHPSGDELAALLAERMRRLEAMRDAGRRLIGLARLGLHVFPRGQTEAFAVNRRAVWDTRLYDLLSAYAALRLRGVTRVHHVHQRNVITLQDARERLMRLLGGTAVWAALDSYLTEYLVRPELRRTARASTLSASLELVREGEIELRQAGAFAPLFVRRRQDASAAARKAANG